MMVFTIVQQRMHLLEGISGTEHDADIL